MKIVKYIPDAITSMNLLCGTLGVIASFQGRADIAFCLMLAAAVFDFCDGLAARALDAYSDFGKELDSLSDLVSFGVLPAVMMVCNMKTFTFSGSWLCYVPVLLAVFTGLRLAKFNLDPRQHDSFIGLPSPACAMLCGSVCCFTALEPSSILATWAGGFILMPVLTVVMCFLLVCEIPMFSIKMGKGTAQSRTLAVKRLSFLVEIALVVVLVAALHVNWTLAVALSFAVYILKNLIYAIFKV